MSRDLNDGASLIGAADNPLPELEALATRLRERAFLYDDPGCYRAGVTEFFRAIVVARAKREHPSGSRPPRRAPERRDG